MEADVAVATVVESDGRVLLVQEGKEGVEGVWNLPCGNPEEGEGLKEAAVRETREETGLKVELGRVRICLDSSYTEGKNVVNFVYSAEKVGGELRPHEEDTVKDVEFYSPKEVQELWYSGELRAEYIPAAVNYYVKGDDYSLEEPVSDFRD